MTRVLSLVTAGLLVAGGAFAQTPAPAAAPVSLAAGLQRAYAGIKTNLTDAGNRTAEADFGFRASPEVRTFGAQLGHVANSQYASCAAAKGVPNPNQGTDLEKKATKAELVKALADSFAFCDDAFASLTDQSALELVAQPGRGQMARGALLSNAVAHANEEYGIITVYMRLKGMVPPSTANRAVRH